MTTFQIASVLICVAAVFSFINVRVLRLPTTIGVMFIALAFSLMLFSLGPFVPATFRPVTHIVQHVDFNEVLLHGMLAFLLFAGALHLDLGDLSRHWQSIASLAVLGTALSAALVGFGTWYVLNHALGIAVPLATCFLFGAIISP